MLKILQARLQQYVSSEILDIQVGFRKGRGTRDQIANIPFKSGKLLKIWGHQTILPSFWEIYMWVKKQQLEHYMEKLTDVKLGKE